MRRAFLLWTVRGVALAAYLAAYYGLLYFSIFTFLGESVAESPFGPTSILMVLLAASGLPVLRAWLSDAQDRHRTYLVVRWSLMLLYLAVGVPVSLGLIEYGGPFNLIALGLGLVLSLAFFLFAVAVALPLFFFASGVIRAKPGHVHTGAFLGILVFPMTTFRLFLTGSDDFATFFQAWLILAGLLAAWDWAEIGVKLTRAVRAVERGLAHNPVEMGLAAYLPSGLLVLGVSFALVNVMHELLVERTVLGGPTSYFHVFFWMAVLLVAVLAIGFLARLGRTPRLRLKDGPAEPAGPQSS